MGLVTVILGLFLTALGVVGYVATGSEHATALIPTWFGIAFLILGVLSRQEKMRMHVMHMAVLLGLVGFVATVMGLVGAIQTLVAGSTDVPAPAASKSLMALACLVYVILCVRSFIEARRRRRAG